MRRGWSRRRSSAPAARQRNRYRRCCGCCGPAPRTASAAICDPMSAAVLAAQAPRCAAVAEVLVNHNALSTLQLAHARGGVLRGCARAGLPCGEYAPRLVKKAIVGTGGAAKEQVQAMLRVLLPGAKVAGADAADALAVAICHANHRPRL